MDASFRSARRTLSLITLAMSLVLALAACGGSSASTAGHATASAGPASGASTSPPAAKTSSSQAPVPVESNPPGDIPDNVAFVSYTNPAAGYSFTHPEGWARTVSGSRVTFTDKLNGVRADTAAMPRALDEASVRSAELPRLRSTQPAFELVSVSPASLPAGNGVKVVYRRNSVPDPVTGRQVRDEVEEYLVSNGSTGVRLSLFGPVGADNVDAYQTISTSLRLP